MFGQAMAHVHPADAPGIVVFMRGYNPQEIVRQIHTRRISVLVSVPKILEMLRDHVIRLFPETAQPDPGDRDPLAAPLVALPAGPPAVRMEVLGAHRRRPRRSPPNSRSSGRSGLHRHSGLRADRDGAHRHAEPSVPRAQGHGGIADRRCGGEDRARRRDPGARRQRHQGLLRRRDRWQPRSIPKAGCTRATSARWTPKSGCRFAGARRK